MTERQEEALDELFAFKSKIETSRDICELIVSEAHEEQPTERDALYAYRNMRILARTLFDRLTNEAAELKEQLQAMEEALKNGR